MTIKLIMFDLDGTLVDTAQDITNALNFAIKPYGIKSITVEGTIKLIGEGVSRLVEKILPAKKMNLKSEIMNRFLEYYSEHLIDNSKGYPHVKETLENLTTVKRGWRDASRIVCPERLPVTNKRHSAAKLRYNV